MSEFKAAGFSDEFSGGPDLVRITTFTSPYYFIPPSGTTAERPSGAPPGMLRFNTDIGRLEVWRNDHWATILGESPNLGNQNASSSESGGTGTRAIFGGGYTAPGGTEHMDYITIDTLGNALDFGDLGTAIFGTSGYAGNVFGFFSGYAAAGSNIYRNTIASTGSSADSTFDLSVGRGYVKGLSNSTRAIICAGSNPSNPNGTNIIDYHSIPVGGNAVDFGNLTNAIFLPITCASSVRGICAGGQTPTRVNTIDYVSIQTTGNAVDFGDFTINKAQVSACSNGHGGLG